MIIWWIRVPGQRCLQPINLYHISLKYLQNISSLLIFWSFLQRDGVGLRVWRPPQTCGNPPLPLRKLSSGYFSRIHWSYMPWPEILEYTSQTGAKIVGIFMIGADAPFYGCLVKICEIYEKNVWKLNFLVPLDVCFCPHLSELCKFSWWDESECVCNLSPNSNLTFTFSHFPSHFNFSVGGVSSQQPYWHAFHFYFFFHFHCYRYIFSFLLLL